MQTNTSKIYKAEFDPTSENRSISDKNIAIKVSLFSYSKVDPICKELEILDTLDHENIIKPT